MKVNSHYIKLSGEFEIPQPLKLGNEYQVFIKVNILKQEFVDNQDGTMDQIQKGKVISGKILSDDGKLLSFKDKRRNSQKIRAMIEYFRKEKYPEIDEEEFYNSFTNKILANFEEVAQLLESSK